MPLDNNINQFMNLIHGGDPTTKFNNVMGQASIAEYYGKKNGDYLDDYNDLSMLEEEVGFGGGGGGYQQPQYPPAMRNQGNSYNQYQQQYRQPPQMLSEYQMRQYQQQYQPQLQQTGRRNLSNLPPEIAESMEERPIDTNVFDPYLGDNAKNNQLRENTRMDLFIDSPNPWNPKLGQQQMLVENPYQNNMNIPQGIPIQPAINYIPPMQQQVNNSNPLLEKLVENISVINKKLGLNEDTTPVKKETSITLNINGRDISGTIKQEKQNKRRILFILEDGKLCYELVPSSLKKITNK
jgi:hypothetical protein